ncbi:type VII secretion-associated serine protease mycosin [Micromonospora sp. HB375]|uniref:type VII secretion-associated serine protease mycosin n=1 Tax=unclassified Micromonospora TaxID=2617518 RepID=UPI001AE1EDC9|nr:MULTISPECIES: type VII secretion-associated serine protease mycosin [unclassified Micromonospora]MBP1782746.1 type VII secretion-associated serine protease mycosin [Micromonospora sp. HB375]MDH6472006.1 membrane-anchored mycosin MYCP [Micromonospora sp. H404/HB375]
MSVNASMLRPVAAGLLSVLLVGAAAQPAVAAPQRAEQWYLDELRIEQVRKLSTGRSVIVGVVDSGVDATHPDLRGRVLPGGRSYGATGDGRADEDGHGTHMAGIIAATNAAADGVDGIAPGARILPIKIKKGKGRASSQAVAQGIRMAVDGGATVVNVSVGGAAAASPGEKEAITYALAKDVVVVVSAGNIAKGEKAVTSPANIPGVIAVTGTTRGGAFWSGSVQGPEAAVSAPGDGIFNIGPNHGYGWGDGTSDSAAIVSGVVALIRSKYPDLDAANVINRIIRTARDAGPAGRDPQYGFGRIDPVAALTADVPAVSENPLLGPTPPATGADQAAGDDNFDVTRYGDQGGPSDQQVAVIAVGAGLVVLILLMLTIFLIRNRRRHRAEEAVRHDLAGEVPSAGFSRQSH